MAVVRHFQLEILVQSVTLSDTIIELSLSISVQSVSLSESVVKAIH